MLIAVKSRVLEETPTAGSRENALSASPSPWQVTAPFSNAVRGPAGWSHGCCGSGGSLGLCEVQSLGWGAEHSPPQRGAALVPWL